MSIVVGDNFDYKAGKPLDGRVVYATLADMKAVADSTMYNGCLAYCVATDKTYQWKLSNTVDPDTGKWRDFSTGSTTIIYDERGTEYEIGTYIDAQGVSTPVYTRHFLAHIEPGEEKTSPIMTSNTAPTPYVISSSGCSNNYQQWGSFKDITTNAGTYDCFASTTMFPNPAVPPWLKIDMGEPIIFNKLRMSARTFNNTGGLFMPTHFIISGSNDGENFTDIYEGHDTWAANDTTIHEYDFENQIGYRYYKITVLANGKSNEGVIIGRLQYKSIFNWSDIIPNLDKLISAVDNYDGSETFQYTKTTD